MKGEDERLRKELDDKLQQQLEQVLAKKAAEAEEIEKQIIEHERIESAKVVNLNSLMFLMFYLLELFFDEGECCEGSCITPNGAVEERPPR